jgi:hypothetical protein
MGERMGLNMDLTMFIEHLEEMGYVCIRYMHEPVEDIQSALLAEGYPTEYDVSNDRLTLCGR